MRLVLKVKNLWYLVEGTVKTEDGLPVSASIVAADENLFGALLIDSVHEDNIDLLVEAPNSKSMWRCLEAAHHHTSAGTQYHLLRSLMGLRIGEEDDIIDHLLNISKLGTRLRKMCKDSKISVDDIEVAALTSSLPSSFSGVTSRYETQDTVSYKSISDAVREEVLNRKDRAPVPSIVVPSSANAASSQSKPWARSNPSSSKPTYPPSQSDRPPPCPHCGSKRHDINNCLTKKISDQGDQISRLMKQMTQTGSGQAKIASTDDQCPHNDSVSDSSDYSESRACSATANATSRHTTGDFNLDSGSSDILVPSEWKLENPIPSNMSIRTANNGQMKASHQGDLDLSHLGLSTMTAHTVSGLAEPLLSVSAITDSNKAVVFVQDAALIVDGPRKLEQHIRSSGQLISEGTCRNKSYYVAGHPKVSF